MVKKIGLVLMAVAVLVLGGRALLRALASDETKIRLALEEACEGFGSARMDPVLAFVARDFVDDTTGFEREDLRAALASAFFQEKDPATKGFPYRASAPPESVAVTVQPDRGEATIRFLVRVVDVRGGGERTAWEFTVDGRMRRGDDGWQLVRSTHETRTGSARLK